MNCMLRRAAIKRNARRKRTHRRRRSVFNFRSPKKHSAVNCSTGNAPTINRISTAPPSVAALACRATLENYMHRRMVAAASVAVALLIPIGAQAADEVTLLRVFLTDGSSLVSYGEPALAGDRVVFSMPTAATPNPPLHLVNLPLARVDWERTSRYAANARATHYVQTQADSDYAQLSNDVAATLSDVARATVPAERLAIVERARRTLADWPENHYNYRKTEVQQMLSMLDEAI